MSRRPRPPLPRFRRPAPPPSPRRRLSALWRWLNRLVFSLLMLIVLGVAGVIALYLYYGRDLPPPELIDQHRSFENTRIYARDGSTLLYEVIGPGVRVPVALDRIPQILRDATVAVEDANFYTNPGVDLPSIARAFWQNVTAGQTVSGASTITMQLVRAILLTPEEAQQQSIERKIREAILAIRVGQEYSKDQILSLYLNEVYYGAQAYGVEAAAQRYFGKHVWQLTRGEATLLAGLPQSPSNYNPFENLPLARARQRIVLNQMVAAGFISAAEADSIFAEPIRLVPPATTIQAPHFTFYVYDLLVQRFGEEMVNRGGLRVITTLDPYWQTQAEEVARAKIAELRARDASNAGVVMLSPDGRILAMVGSVDYNAPDGQVNVTMSPRQPGSALKPFVYAAALQRGWTPATILWDVPSSWQVNGTTYQPRNYDGRFRGPVRLRLALANSLNIPAVRALEFVGVENFVNLMSEFGITTFTDPNRYSLAMALGSNEVRLLELTGAYAGLRAGGRQVRPVAILRVTNSRGEMIESWQPQPGKPLLGPQSEQVAFLITDILSDNAARRLVFGRNNVMELPNIPAAVKTGTSNDYRDSWAVGYTDAVVIGVWVGNNDSRPMAEVAGANGAGLIWRELMLRYHANRPAQPFTPPQGIVELPVCAETGGSPVPECSQVISERFMAGTGPVSAMTYETYRVGGDGSCLAAPYTPPEEVRTVSFPVYPTEVAEWAKRNGRTAPTEYCPPPREPDRAIALLDLAESSVVTNTLLFVKGTARGPFILDIGQGADPTGWQVLGQSSQPVEDGLLGMWNAGGWPAGDYTIRLRVTMADGGVIEERRRIRYAP
ncbi:penicillin-binding protein [Chloroflexus islandicus]|uniref:Penicillin-binding protein n=1 Tax=Chloroflexus islandicus TaxID=1707952 RepID=A0A178MI27_9CHLR|nr:PBP1A family penicillin-binding protein [Chloroflexus islandicus]OAN47827.1 penicillin-binding protein [Chloroflexus islandicus]